MAPSIQSNIFVVSAGELDQQVLRFLVEHQQRQNATVSVLLRPASIPSTTTINPQKQKELDDLHEIGVLLVPGDVVEDQEQTLASIFAGYDTIISCMGLVVGNGTQVKLTRAVLPSSSSSATGADSSTAKRYIPWQFGVDYDIIGRGSAQDLFDEQLDVRDLLGSQNNNSKRKVHWTILSTGMFTDFLSKPSFGVVETEIAMVRALGGWDNRVTITTSEDIGRFTADIVLGRRVMLSSSRPQIITT